MKSKRLKLLAVWTVALGLVVVGATVLVCKDDLWELWLLHQLDSEDAEEARRACDSLDRRGSKRSVPRLSELCAVDGPLKETAIGSLGGIFTRAPRLVRLNILEILFDLCEDGDTRAAKVILWAAPGEPSGYRMILERFRASMKPSQKAEHSWIKRWVMQPQKQLVVKLVEPGSVLVGHVSAVVLARGWPASQGVLTDFFSDDKDLRATIQFLRYLGPFQTPPSEFEAAPLEKTSALFRHFAFEHPRPRVRALCLSHAVVKGGRDTGKGGLRNAVAYDYEILSRVFESGRDELVRRACVRIAGVLGQHPESLDLNRLLGEVESSKLLVDVIQARTLWLGYRQVNGFVLFDKTVCDWLPIVTRGAKALPWSEAEIAALQSILETETDPELRDAASLALAEPYRVLTSSRGVQKGPFPENLPGLKVHEWGVWLDGGETAMVPVADVVDELPDFVHRSETLSDALWAQRSYMPMTITKPVVHFYSTEPVSLFVEVQFHRGQPWTFFPEATDYTLSTKTVPRGAVLPGGSVRRRAANIRFAVPT